MNVNSKYITALWFVACINLYGCAQDSSYDGYVLTSKEYNLAEYSAGSNWQYGKALQADGRYEIAKEYFLLALAAAQTTEEQEWLERELFIVDLQIKSRR